MQAPGKPLPSNVEADGGWIKLKHPRVKGQMYIVVQAPPCVSSRNLIQAEYPECFCRLSKTSKNPYS